MDHSSKPPKHPDEISLREIYLTIKRGFGFIVTIAILLAVLGFLYGYFSPPSYEALSTTSVAPSSINVQSTKGVSLSPRTNIPYEAYERLALSTPVLAAVLKQFPDLELELAAFQGKVSVEQVLGPIEQAPQMAQTVSMIAEHKVKYEDAEIVAELARVWVNETLAVVKQTLNNNLQPINAVTQEQRNQLRSNLTRAENNLEAFRTEHNVSLVSALFSSLTSRVASQQLELNDIQRQITVATERRDALRTQLTEESNKITTSSPTSDTFLAGLSLGDAKSLLEEQLTRADVAFHSAQTAVNDFVLAHDLNVLAVKIENYGNDLANLPFQVARIDDQLRKLRSEEQILQAQLAEESAKVTTSNALSDTFLAGLSLQEGRDFLQAQLELSQNNFMQARQERDAFNEVSDLARIQVSLTIYQEEIERIPFKLRDAEDALNLAKNRQALLTAQLTKVRSDISNINATDPRFFIGLSIKEAETFIQEQLALTESERAEHQASLNAFDEANDLSLLAEQIGRYETEIAQLPFQLRELEDKIANAEAQQKLFEQQLSQESTKVTSTNPLSDAFISGLGLDEARVFLSNQHNFAEDNFQQARQALEDFDNTYDFTVLNAQINAFADRTASIPFTLSDLELRKSIQGNLLSLLEQQLADLRQRTNTTNAASDSFLVGRTISDAQSIIATQLAQAQEARAVSRLALDNFDQQHDLAVRQADINSLRDRIVSKNARLEELPGEVDVIRTRLANLEQQLGNQPQLLQLRDTVIGNDVLSELARQEGLEALFNSELISDTLNPVHTNLLSSLLSNQVQLDNLITEQAILQQELIERRAALEGQMQVLIDLRREREDLAILAAQDASRYTALLARLEQFDYALLDPQGANRLLVEGTDTTNLAPTFAIESRQREIISALQSLESEMAGLNIRLTEATSQLPELRAEKIRLVAERERLTRRVEETRSTLNAVQEKIDIYARSGLDPRGERIVRDTTPEVLELQSGLRAVERNLLALHATQTNVQAKLDEAQTLLPTLRQERTRLAQERELISLKYRVADDNFKNFFARLNSFSIFQNDPRGLERTFQEANVGDFKPPALVLEEELRNLAQTISQLEEEIPTLRQRLVEAETQAPTLRQASITLANQKRDLDERYQRTEATLQVVQQHIDNFERNALDPRSDRILRDTTPEVLSLQSSLRALEQEKNALQQERRALTDRIDLAESELPALRAQQAEASTQLNTLNLELSQAEATRNTMRSRLETFRYNTQGSEERTLRDSTPEVLELQKALREADIQLTVLRTSLASLQEQLSVDAETLQTKQAELAILSEQQTQLEAELATARGSYNEILALMPTISYLSEITSVSAQVISEASVPLDTTNINPILLAVLAGFVGGFLALVFVFIRSAIRDPNEQPPGVKSRRQAKLAAANAAD